jgi:3D (Asp-Asp-Asp) domain-containing protein
VGQDRTSGAARLAAICTGFLVVVSVPVALAAGAATPPQTRTPRAAASSLEAREQTATLELYALESQLGRARRELAAVTSQQAAVAREQRAARRQVAAATEALRVAQARLAALVRALYEQSGRSDPLAVVLGAESLEEALNGLDSLERAAGQNDRIIEQTRSAGLRLSALGDRLAVRQAQLDRLAASAAARTDGLAAATAARRGYVEDLRRRQRLNAARIAAVQTRARAATRRSVELSPAAAPTESTASETREPATVPRNGTLTVLATGYSIHGTTSTGIPTGPGVVAVDPAVIPLGARLTIPGYGTAVAADTGGAVNGNVIDVWFPTRRQALAWGTRTVTITIG